MITDLFLNSCFSVTLNKTTKIKKNKTVYRDIIEILDFFKEKQKNEIPINIQNKVECLYEICKLKLNEKTDDNVIDSILYGQKFKTLADFIATKRNEEVSDDILSDHICQIRMRKKLNGVVSNYDEISKFLDIIKSGNYDSIDEIIFKYFQKYSISCTDIMMHLDDVIDQYGKESIRGLYVDYLDLLKADITNELYRLELGFITSGLKDIAVKYNIPVVTVSQLGRAVYRNQDSKSLNMDMMSESIKKIEHADFIALMSKDQVKDDEVHLKVTKNRCGKDNVAIDFKVNFKHFKFLNGLKASNDGRPDITSDQMIEIESLNASTGKTEKFNPFKGMSVENNVDTNNKSLANIF